MSVPKDRPVWFILWTGFLRNGSSSLWFSTIKITRRTIGSKSWDFLIIYNVILIFQSNLSINLNLLMLVKQIAVSDSIWQYLTVSENIWQYLAVSDNIWLYLTVSDNIWQFPTVYESILQFLKVSDNIWQYLTVSDSILQHLTVSSSILQYITFNSNALLFTNLLVPTHSLELLKTNMSVYDI